MTVVTTWRVPYKFDCIEKLTMKRYLVGDATVHSIGIREVQYDRAMCLVPQMTGIANQKLCMLQQVGVWDYIEVGVKKGVDVGTVT